MEWITLRPNVPVELVLAYNEGRLCKTGYLFGAAGGRALFVDPAAGAEIQQRMRELGVRRGDRVRILAEVSYAGGQRQVAYHVYRLAGRSWGAQADGTFVVPCIGGRP